MRRSHRKRIGHPQRPRPAAANAYTQLALHADDKPRWRHYAAKGEVHSLRTRNSRGEGYVRSRIFDEIRLAKVRLAQREPAESARVGMHAISLAADTRSALIVNWLIGSAVTWPDATQA